MGEPEKKKVSNFESGNTKIYISTDTIRFCSIRRLIQIGCLNSRTDELVHFVNSPGVLENYCSSQLFNYLKFRNLASDQPWYLKENNQKQGIVKDVLPHFISFLKKEKDTKNMITLVFYSIAEYHELVMVMKSTCDTSDNVLQDFCNTVDSIVIYEHYKNKVSDKIKDISSIDSLLDVKVRVYSSDKLAELLRTLFVDSDKHEDKYYPLQPDPEKLPKIKVSYPRTSWCSKPRYLLLSSTRVYFSGRDWKEDPHPIPREEYRFLPSIIDAPDTSCVTAFRCGLFRCNQPVILKFKDLQENTSSISYSGNLLNCYKCSGSCPLYTFNSVTFAIVPFIYQEDFKDCTELNDSDFVQHKGFVDNEIDIYARILEPDQPVLKFTEKTETDISVKEDNRRLDLVVADLDRKNTVNIRKGMLKSVLIKLTPPTIKSDSTTDLSMSISTIFIVNSVSSQFKDLKIVNQVFCLAKDESQLVRLVLTAMGEDVTLHTGNVIGQAVPINQSNFGEALVQAFQHEMDVTEFILNPIKKRRLEDEEEEARERLKEKARVASYKKKVRKSDPDLKRLRNMEEAQQTGYDDGDMYMEDLGMRRQGYDTYRGADTRDDRERYNDDVYYRANDRFDYQQDKSGGWSQYPDDNQEYQNQQYLDFLENIGERR